MIRWRLAAVPDPMLLGLGVCCVVIVLLVFALMLTWPVRGRR